LKVGKVTSGTYSPFLKKGIALGYVQKDLSQKCQEVLLLGPGPIRIPARIASFPFYPTRSKHKKGVME